MMIIHIKMCLNVDKVRFSVVYKYRKEWGYEETKKEFKPIVKQVLELLQVNTKEIITLY